MHCVRLSSLDGGRVMVSGSTDRTLRAWDTPTGRETKTMRAPSSCNALDLSAVDSGVVVSGHQDGSVRLWDLRNHGGCLATVWMEEQGGGRLLWAAGRLDQAEARG